MVRMVRVGRERLLGSQSSRVTCRQFIQGVMRVPCRLGLRFWKLAGALFCSAGGCRASRVPAKRGGRGGVDLRQPGFDEA